MKTLSSKRTIVLLLLTLAFVSFGCSKRAATTPTATTPPPPPPPPPPAPGITLSADRNTITEGESVTLTWNATNAATVTIQPGVGNVPASGSRQVSPTMTTAFTAEATGPGGTGRSAAVNVTVNPRPAPPPPPATTPPKPPPPGRTIDELFTENMRPILFDYDKSEIRPDQESKLLNIAAWLKQNPSERFTIEGHADERGSQEYNIALGDERAASTRRFLEARGIAAARMNTVSYGEERPTCRVSGETCWQQNRRASFTRNR